jgi:trehalose 6-phosphate synthase/phosphatase
MAAQRLLLVSNRLPVTARLTDTGVRLSPAHGGLASGVRSFHEESGGLWIGWPGDVTRFTAEQRAALDDRLRERAIAPVYLTREQVDRYYHGFSNRILWPLFHYLIDRMPLEPTGWDAYCEVNRLFADAVVRQYRPGDRIWVHDYQLMLLPGLLRQRLPDARIGFFLHIPFPSSEIFRILPWRRAILSGVLGADLVGLHAASYMRHFLTSLLHVVGVEADLDRVRIDERDVKVGVFPMGVDAARFASLAADPQVEAEVEAIRREAGERRIVLGVDRLDYTKGIPRRLQALERLLTREPDLRDRLRYIQVAVPSRGEVDSYQRFKREVEESVGRVNGACGTIASAPVHYVHRSVSMRRLVALYRAADLMLVTPLRDGMNLVAKEFVAARRDGDGVLILSEFAGAAAELEGALVVNPYDVDEVANAIQEGLSMPVEERRSRMQALRRRVADYDSRAWAGAFLDVLDAPRPRDREAVVNRPEADLPATLDDVRRQGRLRLLLDYDGTLVPIASSPELAAPDEELLHLLDRLTALDDVAVDIVSGRPRETLEGWLGHLPVALWAEHGFWHRRGPGRAWEAAAPVPAGWIERITPILEQFTASTPGSHVELKSASIAWHYRRAQPEFGSRQAHELRLLLRDALYNQPFEVLEGSKVIEIRLRGISKALVAHHVKAEASADATVLAIGDDRTDEDLVRALPASSVTIAVGRRATRARFRLDDHRAVRRVLRLLVAGPGSRDGGWRRRAS